MKMSSADLQVIRFNSEDVIATSGMGPLSGTSGMFYIPAADYSGSYSGSGNFVQFNGTLGSYSGGNYLITNIYGAEAGVDSDKESLESVINGNIVFPDVGITVPATALEPLARQTYDAFSYGNGQYYTNGVSYYETHWQ